MAHILVLGASNGIGFETVKAALQAGHTVRAFARSASKIDLADQGLERFSGDALRAQDVKSALDEIDAVVQALGVPFRDLFQAVSLFSESTNILVPAMESGGVRRLIAVTGFGAGDSERAIGLLQRVPFQLVFGRAYRDKDVQEMRIKKSKLDWTIVRPGVLTGGSQTGKYQVLDQPSQWRNGRIARANVADFIIRQIDKPTHVGQAPVLIQ